MSVRKLLYHLLAIYHIDALLSILYTTAREVEHLLVAGGIDGLDSSGSILKEESLDVGSYSQVCMASLNAGLLSNNLVETNLLVLQLQYIAANGSIGVNADTYQGILCHLAHTGGGHEAVVTLSTLQDDCLLGSNAAYLVQNQNVIGNGCGVSLYGSGNLNVGRGDVLGSIACSRDVAYDAMSCVETGVASSPMF